MFGPRQARRRRQGLELWDNIRTNYGNDNVAADAYNIVEPLLIQRLVGQPPPAVGLTGPRSSSGSSSRRPTSRWRTAAPKPFPFVGIRAPVPGGTHMAEAQFYLANCLLTKTPTRRTCRTWRCSPCPHGDFSEAAALGAATIAWNNGSTARPRALRDAGRACRAVEPLGSGHRPMRCHYLLGQETKRPISPRVMYDPATRTTSNGPPNFGTRASHATGERTVLRFGTPVTFEEVRAQKPSTSWQNTTTTPALDACEEKLFGLIEQFYNQDAGRTKDSAVGEGLHRNERPVPPGHRQLSRQRASRRGAGGGPDLLLEIDALKPQPQNPTKNEAAESPRIVPRVLGLCPGGQPNRTPWTWTSPL